jgi:hypothetical protein
MPFTEDEKRRWHDDKRSREQQPVFRKSQPVAVCVHCQNPFGINEGTITPEVSICDVCNGD